ncbi:acyl-CoA dehydrogenase family protein [Pseudogracilibacillus auburnensis]|uniref:Alkylation response protein AidB-like acyl-CoA dehydrogenase n=1 Tax=Pseudogracilibacillus auburnensis TaxID=1494959 RepID=A0A2V3W1P7_9BACI|nr:acyl-CoA dehydrogenase family protein [Pseudogracilibacillus auburnensis]PXW88002.1 alkylation response protein AidB-like acyl-CoA dehydrogenase [Pseudogracilibacillus auburnensis]
MKSKVRPQVLEAKEKVGRRNFFTEDDTLHKILETKLGGEFLHFAQNELTSFGDLCANEIDERAVHTDREGEPRLISYDRYGEEVSHVWVNEGYKQTVNETYGRGIVGYVHKEIPDLNQKGNYVYSFAQGYVLSQAEAGFYCPVTLTLATAYLLDHYGNDEVKERFLHHVCSTGEVPLYEGATFLTERQGGSDVGANVVQAVKEGEHYQLYGEKYFASNAGMCGVAMVLARMEGAPNGTRGLTLFAVPWKKDDGTLNNVRIRRLKDKLGVRAVPSGEVEFNGAIAYVVGDPTKGFYYMMEALNLSRVSNAVASVGIMRRAYIEAVHYASRRNAFGKRLTEYPMVQHTLGKLKAKWHAELVTVFDLISLFEKVSNGKASERETILNRLFIAIMKKETAEQAIHFCHEAIEMHGGNGYIEDFVTPRLLRDAQVLTVWEGTANILGLELTRLVNKYDAHLLFIDEMKARLDQLQDGDLTVIIRMEWAKLKEDLTLFSRLHGEEQTIEAKWMAERMAHLYESIVVLEWAETYGDDYLKLAKVYVHVTWGERKVGDEMVTVKYFHDIV